MGGDVDRLTEIVRAIVEHDCQAGPFVQADLQGQLRPFAAVVQLPHRPVHLHGSAQSGVGRGERRHHRITDRFHDCAAFAANRL